MSNDVPGFPGLQVCWSAAKGRHLVVKRPCKAGEVLLKHKPYAATLQEDQPRCDHCLRPSTSLQRCARCKQAKYCSREHQRQAWQVGLHTKECTALCAMQPRTPPPTVRLAARALWRAHGEGVEASTAGMHTGTGATAPGQGGSWFDVQGLVHHWERLQDSQKALYAQMGALVRQFALMGLKGKHASSAPAAAGSGSGAGAGVGAGGAPEEALPGVDEVARLLGRLAANAHTICDEELRPVGSGLYPLASMANHSCQPSAMQSFEGDTIVFRALRPLAPGDEVTIAYVELAATRQDRREALFEQYAFDINSLSVTTGDAGSAEGRVGNEGSSGIGSSSSRCGDGHGGGLSPEGGCSQRMEADVRELSIGAGPGKGMEGLVGAGWGADEGAVGRPLTIQQPALPLPQLRAQHQMDLQHLTKPGLRPPPLAQQRISLGGEDEGLIPLHHPGAAGLQGSGLSGGASNELLVRVYGLGQDPPWTCDAPRDAELTQLVLLPQPAQGATLPASAADGCSGGGAGASLWLGRGRVALLGGAQAHALHAQPAQDPTDSFGGFGGMGDGEDGDPEDGYLGQQQQRQSKEQQLLTQQRWHRRKQHVEVDVWGPWAATSSAFLAHAAEPPASLASAATPPASLAPGLPGQYSLQGAASPADPACTTGASAAPLHGQDVAEVHAQQQGPLPPTQPQLDVGALALELGALEALVVHAEGLMVCGPSAAAVQLLLQGLSRADGFGVPTLPPPPPPPLLPSSAPVLAPPTPPASGAAPMPSTSFLPLPEPVMPGPQGQAQLALGPLHGLRVRLAATLLRAAVEEGSSWPVALQAARMLTPLYRQLYPPVWPNLGLHLAQHAKLAMLLEHAAEAAGIADEALRILCITHAGQGGVCDEVARIRWEAQQEVAA